MKPNNALNFVNLHSNPPKGTDWAKHTGEGLLKSWHLVDPPVINFDLVRLKYKDKWEWDLNRKEWFKREFSETGLQIDRLFSNNLPEICDYKLQLILKRQKVLKRELKKRVRFLLSTELTEGERVILTGLSAAWYSEYFTLDKWSHYWTNIWLQVSEEKKKKYTTVLNQKMQFEEKVRKAKEFLLEDLYPGQLRRSGSRMTGTCPFHNPEGEREKSPSFYIFNDNHFHCFSCGEKGDSIDFVMKTLKLDFNEAIERILNGHT